MLLALRPFAKKISFETNKIIILMHKGPGSICRFYEGKLAVYLHAF